ncbi:biotin--[acetyl-CoA-carboxylase] ligase [Caldimonas caldifontis]|uniref:biotin--[biotin carboxyl-carrier protein] ligase n=1 Tax=Caldimonas caldifontis TaxID=1452508 RepID=A0A2S5SUG1_9BURK|nr:biotin--[acetyl-CoA-carboxylase] ligase [Caldimonas caldifontis]PPE66378.1 biotin--[acetyl-CoA-carboxylase] ligase [Caldimonas caldifontis]
MTPLAWPAEDLWERLEPQLPGLSVEVLAEVDSTNTRLLERARQGDATPCLLVAERQNAGRGRQGRPWQSAPGASLTFSLGLPMAPQRWGGLSLAVGVALAEALHPQLRIKWPNDLWTVDAHGAPAGKLGGILIETQGHAGPSRHVVVGVGLNIEAPPALPDPRNPVAWLRQLDDAATAPATLTLAATALVGALKLFELRGFAAFARRFEARDLLRNRAVVTTRPDLPEARAQGVDEDGALLLRDSRGQHRLDSGEVSVRPC